MDSRTRTHPGCLFTLRAILATLLLALLLPPAASATSPAPRYIAYDLGLFPPDTSYGGYSPWADALGINNSGQIVGRISATGDDNHAVLWQPGGGPVDIGTPARGFRSTAWKINESGQIAGWATDSTGVRAALWQPGLGVTILPPVAYPGVSQAQGLNDIGQIVGYADTPSGRRGLIWQAGQQPVELAAAGLSGAIDVVERHV